MSNPSKELLLLHAFAEKQGFDKYKCEVGTTSGCDSPILELSIDVQVSEKIREAFFEHLKDVYQFYSLSIKELTFFECRLRQKQLNVWHNVIKNATWNG
jgi:hypothetical protein